MTSDIGEDGGRRAMRRGFATSPETSTGHVLTYMDGLTLVRVPVGAGGLVIGRSAPADLKIASSEISRLHCRVDIRGDEAVLTDLGSATGTFLDGNRIAQPVHLPADCRFTLGAFPVLYERRDLRMPSDEADHAAELRRAEDRVRAVLPQPIATGPVRADWCFVPAARLGGNAFGYQFLDADTFTGFLLDVSGHGIGAAMHAVTVANTLRQRALPGIDFRDPAEVAAGLNDVFPMEEPNDLTVSLWYFACHLPSRDLSFCAAGHHPAFLVSRPAPDPEPLWTPGPAIGALPIARWTTGSLVLPPAARLYMFSGGTFEIPDPHGRHGTIDMLRHRIAQPAQPGLSEPQRLYRAVRDAARPGPLDDDFSLLVVSFD